MKVYHLEDFIKETEKDLPFIHRRLAIIRRSNFKNNLFDAVRMEKGKFLYDELERILEPRLSREELNVYKSLEEEILEISPQENNRVSFRSFDRDSSNIMALSRYPDEEEVHTIGQNVQVFSNFPNGAFIERLKGDQVFFQDLKSFEIVRHKIFFDEYKERNIFTIDEFKRSLNEGLDLDSLEIYIIYEELPFTEDGYYQCDVRLILFEEE